MRVLQVGLNSSIIVPDGTKVQFGDIVKVPFQGSYVIVTYCKDRLWRDDEGTIWGFTDPSFVGDPIVRCGVGIFSLPENDPLTDACRPHDYAFSSPAYQKFHTMHEANLMLEKHIQIIGRGSWRYLLAKPFYYLAELFGGFFWDNRDTRR